MNIRKLKKQFDTIREKYIVSYLKKVPGEKKFGVYRFLPFFFVLGACLEYFMIHWKVGPHQVNFCKYIFLINLHAMSTIN
jgi:hypothetical protein